MWDRGIE